MFKIGKKNAKEISEVLNKLHFKMEMQMIF